MGTRADFYVGRGKDAEWLGSIAYDGYPSDSDIESILTALTEETFRKAVTELIQNRDDGTMPERGWPWPWNTSKTTDYAYAYDAGRVWYCYFGRSWLDPLQEMPEAYYQEPQDTEFPDMTARQKVAWDRRSGALFVRLPSSGDA